MKVFPASIKNKIRLTAFLLCIIVALLCLCLLQITNKKENQFNAARHWQSGHQEFAYISVYISPEENWKENDRNTLVSSLKMSFQQNSIINEKREDNSQGLLNDCFSCEGAMEFTNGKNTASAKVTATGGDFFFFHRNIWLSGSAYSDNDIMKDRVVINKQLAWQLFGGENVAGMPFKINGNTYYVAGVVDVEEPEKKEDTNEIICRAWLPYSTFCNEYNGQGSTSLETGDIGIGTDTEENINKLPVTCYEIVMPDPVKNWALNIIQQNLDTKNRKMVIVENSNRTNFFYVINNIKNFFYKTTNTKPVAYPYWENEAKVRDTQRELYTCILIIAIIYPVLLVIRVITRIYKTIDNKIKKRIHKKHSIEV